MEIINDPQEKWSEIIRKDLSHTIEGLFAAGQHLLEAREEIPHGSWESFVRDKIGFSKQWADRLISIAKNTAFTSNVKSTLPLPINADTLYILSRLEPQKLSAAIADGRITQETKQEQARALVAELSDKPKKQIVKLAQSRIEPKQEPIEKNENDEFHKMLQKRNAITLEDAFNVFNWYIVNDMASIQACDMPKFLLLVFGQEEREVNFVGGIWQVT